MHLYIHHSIIYNSQDLEAIQLSISRRVDKNAVVCPGQVAQLVGGFPHAPKSCEFAARSGHIPMLCDPAPAGVCTGGNLLMFISHIDVSVSHTLCLFLSPIIFL